MIDFYFMILILSHNIAPFLLIVLFHSCDNKSAIAINSK